MCACVCVCVLVEVCVEGLGGLGRVEGSLNAFHVCGLHTHTHTHKLLQIQMMIFFLLPKTVTRDLLTPLVCVACDNTGFRLRLLNVV